MAVTGTSAPPHPPTVSHRPSSSRREMDAAPPPTVSHRPSSSRREVDAAPPPTVSRRPSSSRREVDAALPPTVSRRPSSSRREVDAAGPSSTSPPHDDDPLLSSMEVDAASPSGYHTNHTNRESRDSFDKFSEIQRCLSRSTQSNRSNDPSPSGSAPSGSAPSGPSPSGPPPSGPAPSGPSPSGPSPSGPSPIGPTPSGPAPSGTSPSGPSPSGPSPSGPAPSGPAPSGSAPNGPSDDVLLSNELIEIYKRLTSAPPPSNTIRVREDHHIVVPAASNNDVVSSIMHLYVQPQPKDDACLHSADNHAAHVVHAFEPYTPPPHPYNNENVFDKSRQCNYSSIPDTSKNPHFASLYEEQHASDVRGGVPPPLAHSSSAYGGVYNNKNHGVTRLLADFGEKSRNGEWPSSTNVSCYSCCHKFVGVPFGLPTKMNMDEDRKFHVIGCFCSLECACAYNFASRDNTDKRLARYTLLNNMAMRMGFTQVPVKAAPDRLALDMFGGHMTIEEFRNTTEKHVIVNTTPMLSTVQQAEELNEQDMHSEYRYISLDKNRVCKFQEKIKLKRSKPLIGGNNKVTTLDQSMKLTFKNV
eukprot:gene17343-23649_t